MLKINLSREAIAGVLMAVILTALLSPLMVALLTCPAAAIITYGLVHFKTFSARTLQRSGSELAVTAITLVVVLATTPAVFIASLVSAMIAFLFFRSRV